MKRMPLAARELATLRALGDRHRLGGAPVQAEPFVRAALALALASVPTDPMALAAALNSLGLVCKDLASYDESRSCYEHALVVLESAAATDTAHMYDSAIASLYHNLGGIEHARGSYAAGEAFARIGIERRRRHGVPGDVDQCELAADLVALGALLDGQEEFDEADRLYHEALAVLERAPDQNAGEIAVALNDLGAHEAKRGHLQRAERLLDRAAKIKRRLLGTKHPDLAVTLNNLAMVCKRQGDFRRAAALFCDALDVFTCCLGESHPKTVACRSNHDRCIA